jgi:hypothetical protein
MNLSSEDKRMRIFETIFWSVLLSICLTALLNGCYPEVRHTEFPADIYIVDGDFSDAEIEAIKQGADQWNVALNTNVPVLNFRGQIPKGKSTTDCNAIYIRKVPVVPDGGGPATNETTWKCYNNVYIAENVTDYVPAQYHFAMYAHEFGHTVIGPGHVDDPDDLMHEKNTSATIKALMAKGSLISDLDLHYALKRETIKALVDGPQN